MKGFKYFIFLFFLTYSGIAYADDYSDLRATIPVVESNIKAVEPQLLTCLQNEHSDSIKIRIKYEANGKIQQVNTEGANKQTGLCIREVLAKVTFDIDVSSIIEKRKAEIIPTKASPKYKKDENGKLVRVGWVRGTVSPYWPEGKVTYVYNSKDKTLTVKRHYMIGRLK